MDEISIKIDDEVIMQIGNTDYKPKNTKWFKFIEYDKMNKLYEKADIIYLMQGQEHY